MDNVAEPFMRDMVAEEEEKEKRRGAWSES
jgi:hypothetical protein